MENRRCACIVNTYDLRRGYLLGMWDSHSKFYLFIHSLWGGAEISLCLWPPIRYSHMGVFDVCLKEMLCLVSLWNSWHPLLVIIQKPFASQPVCSFMRPCLLREMLENGVCVASSSTWLFLPLSPLSPSVPGSYYLSPTIALLPLQPRVHFNVGVGLQSSHQVTFWVTVYGAD